MDLNRKRWFSARLCLILETKFPPSLGLCSTKRRTAPLNQETTDKNHKFTFTGNSSFPPSNPDRCLALKTNEPTQLMQQQEVTWRHWWNPSPGARCSLPLCKQPVCPRWGVLSALPGSDIAKLKRTRNSCPRKSHSSWCHSLPCPRYQRNRLRDTLWPSTLSSDQWGRSHPWPSLGESEHCPPVWSCHLWWNLGRIWEGRMVWICDSA